MIAPFLWIDGLPGAGKTCVAEQIAEAFRFRPYFEPVQENPFLDSFYKDPARYAFGMQIFLLHLRYAMQRAAEGDALLGRGVVLDRGIPGDRVFCRIHIQEGNIDPVLWTVYETAFTVMTTTLLRPSLLVYLDVTPETALRRVRTRGRVCEADGISLQYLRKLQAGYEELITEIESRAARWAEGIRVLRYDWNEDFQPMDQLFAAIRDCI